MRLFLDTNILIDIIEDRTEFAEDSSAVLILAEQLGANLSSAWHGLATAYYIASVTRKIRTGDCADYPLRHLTSNSEHKSNTNAEL